MAKKDSVKVCLNESCPIDVDTDLVECTNSCSKHTGCYLFKHKNVGPVGRCFLYGFDDNQGTPSEDECENALGTTCCQKGLILKYTAYISYLSIVSILLG